MLMLQLQQKGKVHTLMIQPAWPLGNDAVLVSSTCEQRRSPAPGGLLRLVRLLCRPAGDPKPGLCRARGTHITTFHDMP